MTPSARKYTVPPKVLRRSGELMAEFDRVVRDVGAFAVRVGDTMRSQPKEASRFIRELVESSNVLFHKWNLEILYLLALTYTMRFSQLKDHLAGISSRTLSLKLAELERLGLVHREVFSGRPLRVEYSLTDDGRTAARLSVPLVLFLNLKLGLKLEPEADAESRS